MSHRQGLHSDDSPYPGEPLCYCDEKTPTTSTPTDLDKLKDDIAVEVSIVFKHAKLGTDYTINCTNTIASMAENYARALIQAEIVKARKEAMSEVKQRYANWYNKLSKEHGVKQQVPHTAFHQIIKELEAQLKQGE